MIKNEGKLIDLQTLNDLLGEVCSGFQANVSKDKDYSVVEIIFNTHEDNYRILYSKEIFSLEKKKGGETNLFYEKKIEDIVFILNRRLKKTKGIQSDIKNYIESNFLLESPIRPVFSDLKYGFEIFI